MTSFHCDFPPCTDLTNNETDIQSINETDIQSIPAEDILHVKIVPLTEKEPQCDNNDQVKRNTHRLLVHYVIRTTKQELRMGTGQLERSLLECQNLACDLNNKRGGMPNTPRKFLVLINPISGRGKSQHVFGSIMEPIFKACDVSYDTFVSSRFGDILNTVKNRSLEKYSGIITLGGDGTVNEAFSGLLLRRMRELGLDVDDINCQFMPASIPIGIVPTGSRNWVCQYIQGNSDVTTTTINIIRGKTVPMSVITIHEPERLLCMSALVLHIGFLGDVFRKSEVNRWLGKVRYKVFASTALLQRRLMTAELTISLASSNPSLQPLDKGTQDTSQSYIKASCVKSTDPTDNKSTASVQSSTEAMESCRGTSDSLCGSNTTAGLGEMAYNYTLDSSSSIDITSSIHAPSTKVSQGTKDSTKNGTSMSAIHALSTQVSQGTKVGTKNGASMSAIHAPSTQVSQGTKVGTKNGASMSTIPALSTQVSQGTKVGTKNGASMSAIPALSTQVSQGTKVGTKNGASMSAIHAPSTQVNQGTKDGIKNTASDSTIHAPSTSQCIKDGTGNSASTTAIPAPSIQVGNGSMVDGENGASTSTVPAPPIQAMDDAVHSRNSCVDRNEKGQEHHTVVSGEASYHIQADIYNIFFPVTSRITSDGRFETCLGQSTVPVIVVKKCPLSDFIKHFVKVRDNVPGITDFSFVETQNVSAVKLELTTEETRKQSWYFNIDGECVRLKSNICYFRVQPHIFQAFGPSEK